MKKVRVASVIFTSMFVLALGCGKGTPPDPSAQALAKPDAPAGKALMIDGAGATFPYPIYAQWAHVYEKVAGTKLNYQSIGSGGGIAQIKAKTVLFGASDAPLTVAELEEGGLIQFPLVMGGVVPVINLEGVAPGQMKLSGTVLADVYLGVIKKWNDKAIVELNPDLNLPDKDIAVVHRADGSGTTWIFTNYLDKVSPAWREKVGTDKAVSWPTGMGGKGNEGVAAYVQRVSGSIGYVEFAYALQNQMSHTQLQNQAGKFVGPTIESFQAAAANADWKGAPGFYMVLTDQPGDGSWPITGASFILLHKEQKDTEKAAAMLKFFDWCFVNGSDKAVELHYVPMPTPVIDLVRELWKTSLQGPGGAPLSL